MNSCFMTDDLTGDARAIRLRRGFLSKNPLLENVKQTACSIRAMFLKAHNNVLSAFNQAI